MKTGITAIGTANPKYKRDQLETAAFIAESLNLTPAEKRRLRAVYRATGIQSRYSVIGDYCNEVGQFEFFPSQPDAPFPTTSARMDLYKKNALPLAVAAIENCLANLPDFNKADITHLITVSCTGMYAPGIDIEIIQQLQLDTTIQRTAINFMGCYGAFNALKVADSICKAHTHANVLVVCVELCSIHFQKNMTMDHMISNAIFADGAAAVLVQAGGGLKKSLCFDAFHCDLLPQTSQEMAWHIGDSGFDIVLSSYVPQVIESGIGACTQTLLDKYQLTWSDIHFYAVHPGGIKILQACEKSLDMSVEQNKYAYQVMRDYGNMSSATVLFVLKSIWDDLKETDHQKNLFSCAFGPGLTLESMLLKIQYAQ